MGCFMGITLEKITKENRAEYRQFEIKTDLQNYQSRIYPQEDMDVIGWYYIIFENKPVGSIWLEKKTGDSFAVLGVFIADKSYRNRGFGKQAIKRIIELEQRHMDIAEVYLHVRMHNLRAIACYKSCGFHEFERYERSDGIPVISMKKTIQETEKI